MLMSRPSDTENFDIDDALEKKAMENNLSVVNVKSILHVRPLLITLSLDTIKVIDAFSTF